MSIMRQWGQPWSSQSGDARATNHASFEVITPPQAEPISRRDIQRHARIDFTTDDPSLDLMLVAARQKVEKWLRRSLITQTLEFALDWGPAWVELPAPPILSVTNIKVIGLDNSEVTVPTSVYFADPVRRLVGLKPSAVWPVHITPFGFRVRYQAGYGPGPDDVPAAIKLAILDIAALMYSNRGDVTAMADARLVTLRDYRVDGPPYRFARGNQPPELMA